MNNIIQTIRHAARAAAVLLLALLAAQTAWAENAVTYIDMDGKTKTVTEYTEVTTDMNLKWSSGTYVVKSSVTLNGCIRFDYPEVIDLIVCDGATLTVNGNDDGAFDGTTLNIYAQSNGTGMGVVNVKKHTQCIQLNIAGGKVTLDDDGAGYGLYAYSGDACGLTVNGGDVTIQNSNGNYGAIYFAGPGFVTLNGGKLTVTNSMGNGYKAIEGRGYNTINFNGGTAVINGKIIYCQNINLNGGNVTVNGEIYKNYGYTVTYDFTRATDSYYIKAFSNDVTRTVQVKDGAAFLCNGNKYIGPLTLTDDDISAISGQRMTPDVSDHFSVNDAGTEYTIHTATGWGYFCDMLEAGETFSGKTVELANDITVTRMAGLEGHEFQGTFDGNKKTLTVSISSSDGNAAPFREIMGATIRNLKVSGTVSGHKHSAGLVSYARGADSSVENTIENCLVATDVSTIVDTDGDCYLGGIVGHGFKCKLTIRGCAFTGSLTSPHNYTGGLQGWSDGNTLVLENDLFAASSVNAANVGFHPIAFHVNNATTTATVSNVYYTIAPTCTTASRIAAAGKQARAVTAGTDVTVAHAGVATHYATSGITAYKATGASADSAPFIAGLLYNNNVADVLYAGSDEVVSLTLSNTATGAPDGYQYGYTTNAGTLEGSTLTMPNQDVTVSVNTDVLTVLPWSGDGSKGSPYIIKYASQLDLLAHRVNGTHGETANGYYNTYFQLDKDISYPHKANGEAGADAENNFEAIGGYYGGGNRYFRGHFDGNSKTISGIRIYKNGDGNADYHQGIFGVTFGADIHDLTLADARITGYDYTGGIVGENNDGTVTRCHVAADVAVCAVQYDAYYHGGIVGNNWGTIEQCSSAATLTTADANNSRFYGGIAGYNSSRGTLSDNLAIGATVPALSDNSYGAITGENNGGTLQRNYYTACKVADTPNATGVGCGYIGNDDDGYITADVTANNGAVSIHTLTLADGITTTTAATVTIGTTGYYAQGTTIALSYSGTTGDGYQLGIVRNDGNGFTAAVADGDGHYTAVMPADNATATDHAPIDWATVSTGADKDNAYMIYNKDQLDLLAHRVNGTHGETCQDDGYEGKFFQLAKDISYPHKADGEEGAATESNFEAIGGYYDGYFRYFRGHFDGNNKTISGIRIYKNGDGNADSYQGIFGQTYGADIHHLTLADARITGYNSTGGIVGYNYGGGTVTRCHVAGDVAVCAVQYNAWYHGGIVGYNDGTIEQCTSAATLTTADATSTQYYGGIAGYNDGGILRENLAIGATVPAAADNSYGAITGNNYTGSTLLRNYYTACKVAGVENATGVGCGYIGNDDDGYITADVNNKYNPDGAVCINTLALTANLAPDGNYWTTYYNSFLGFTIDADEHACAYTATYGAGQLTLHKLGKQIPAETAVIIVADNSVVSMTATTDLDDISDVNDLRGVDYDTQTSALGTGTFYVLGKTTVGDDEHFGFHRYTGSTMAAHKAYVLVDNSQARSLTMVFDEASGIESAEADSSLFTLHSSLSTWFTLDGRRLQAKPTAPGIYVNNGKKVVIK